MKYTGMVDCETSDAEIRYWLNRRLLQEHDKESTLVVQELGLDHGRNRIDVAVLNSSLHGFEIKSSRDTLRRLPNQLSVYTSALERLTLVVAPAHLEMLELMLPNWCGILLVEKESRKKLSLRCLREASRNPNPDPFRMAHLLWKSEALALLRKKGDSEVSVRSSRRRLYEAIAHYVPISDLVAYIKDCFVARPDWRVREEQTTGDD